MLMKIGYHYRQWKRKRRLRKELGRKPTFGDIFADMCGYRVDDPEFQRAISDSLGEIGEEWGVGEKWEI
jgi:hypothetical protein